VVGSVLASLRVNGGPLYITRGEEIRTTRSNTRNVYRGLPNNSARELKGSHRLHFAALSQFMAGACFIFLYRRAPLHLLAHAPPNYRYSLSSFLPRFPTSPLFTSLLLPLLQQAGGGDFREHQTRRARCRRLGTKRAPRRELRASGGPSSRGGQFIDLWVGAEGSCRRILKVRLTQPLVH